MNTEEPKNEKHLKHSKKISKKEYEKLRIQIDKIIDIYNTKNFICDDCQREFEKKYIGKQICINCVGKSRYKNSHKTGLDYCLEGQINDLHINDESE
jgi:hypothetical protein